MELSQENLKILFSYDGKQLRWRVRPPHSRVKVGSVAGSYDRSYQRIRINGKNYFAHRLVWLYFYGQWPKTQLDHINGDTMDNRIDNLREVTTQQNQRNCGMSSGNTSGVRGVRRKQSQNWLADITINRKTKNLGTYKSFNEAVKARYNEEVRLGWLGYDSLNNMGSAYSYLKKNHLI